MSHTHHINYTVECFIIPHIKAIKTNKHQIDSIQACSRALCFYVVCTGKKRKRKSKKAYITRPGLSQFSWSHVAVGEHSVNLWGQNNKIAISTQKNSQKTPNPQRAGLGGRLQITSWSSFCGFHQDSLTFRSGMASCGEGWMTLPQTHQARQGGRWSRQQKAPHSIHALLHIGH